MTWRAPARRVAGGVRAWRAGEWRAPTRARATRPGVDFPLAKVCLVRECSFDYKLEISVACTVANKIFDRMARR